MFSAWVWHVLKKYIFLLVLTILNYCTKYLTVYPLFRNKRFALNKMFQPNASKFAIFYVPETPCSFFRFSFRTTLYFYLMNALVYVYAMAKSMFLDA